MSPWRAIRLVHPFPSVLNAAITAVIALLAGGPITRAVLLGAAMLLLQFAIGAANDWSDAPADAVTRPSKPIASGAVGRGSAMLVALVAAAGGVIVAAGAGVAVVAVGVLGLLAGLAYDLLLKGTAWAWLAFAAGFVLLPLFAWLGGAGTIPRFLGAIVVLALPAGAAVSLANGLVDLEHDARAGRRGPAVRLGKGVTLRVLLGLDAVIAIGAVLSLRAADPVPPAAWLGVAAGVTLLASGWAVARAASRRRRLAGWEIQALGLAVLAGAWFAGMAGA